MKEPRFGAIDVHVAQKDGRLESKIVNFRWSPDSSKVGDKMKYAGSEGGFKGKVQAAKMFQANDASDITLEQFVKFVRIYFTLIRSSPLHSPHSYCHLSLSIGLLVIVVFSV